MISGKRKSGKDYVAEKLMKVLKGKGFNPGLVHLSGPLKKAYADIHGLNYQLLLKSDSYKEQFRKDMILWGELKRNQDPSYFCNLAVLDRKEDIFIVVDNRRKTDLQYFIKRFPGLCLCIRITADEETRRSRGFVFSTGIDDAESECGLDDWGAWDFTFDNSTQEKSQWDHQLDQLINATLLKVHQSKPSKL
uniref:Phosphomevalonate kinase n=1 Tax=Arcella intermedia TaxID=1963864 RepID=A0A6B2LJZ4_9EUKA